MERLLRRSICLSRQRRSLCIVNEKRLETRMNKIYIYIFYIKDKKFIFKINDIIDELIGRNKFKSSF